MAPQNPRAFTRRASEGMTMSTILDALRKAKQTPPEQSVDARREILSDHSHNYLATVPESSDSHVRFYKTIVLLLTACLAFLIILLLVVLYLFNNYQRTRPTPEPLESQATAPGTVHNPTAVQAIIPVAAAPTPQATPLPTPTPAPTPASTPTPTATPASPPLSPQALIAAPTLPVSGILWDKTDPLVMINGRTYREGATVAGFIIKKINKDNIIVTTSMGENITLRP